MGGTYPALVRHATERLTEVGRTASQLYGINALGAMLGALVMAFVLMPTLGMTRSLLVLALANALVAIVGAGAGPGDRRGGGVRGPAGAATTPRTARP